MTIKCALLRNLLFVGRQGRHAAPEQPKAANDNHVEWPPMAFPEGWQATC